MSKRRYTVSEMPCNEGRMSLQELVQASSGARPIVCRNFSLRMSEESVRGFFFSREISRFISRIVLVRSTKYGATRRKARHGRGERSESTAIEEDEVVEFHRTVATSDSSALKFVPLEPKASTSRPKSRVMKGCATPEPTAPIVPRIMSTTSR